MKKILDILSSINTMILIFIVNILLFIGLVLVATIQYFKPSWYVYSPVIIIIITATYFAVKKID